MTSERLTALRVPLLFGALVPILALRSIISEPGIDRTIPETGAQARIPFGTWSMGATAPGNLLATHAILLRNNKILIVGGSSYNCCFKWGKESQPSAGRRLVALPSRRLD